MSEEVYNRIQQKYLEQLGKTRQEMGRHPTSGVGIQASEKCRIGIKVEVFHQKPTGQPTVFSNVFHRWLDSTEQPFERHLSLSEQWVPLEHGWLLVDEVGMLTIKNTEGFHQVQPTDEERAEVMQRIIEVGFCKRIAKIEDRDVVYPLIQIRPGESCQFEPTSLRELHIHCRHGKAKAVMLLSPR